MSVRCLRISVLSSRYLSAVRFPGRIPSGFGGYLLMGLGYLSAVWLTGRTAARYHRVTALPSGYLLVVRLPRRTTARSRPPSVCRHPPAACHVGRQSNVATVADDRCMETHHRIAVLCALPQEAELIVEALQGAERSRRYGTDLVTGQLGDVPVVVCVGGMGKVAAGAAAQMLICEYHPEALIFSGIAGSLNPLLEIGDIVIGRSLVYLETNNDIIAECDPFLHTYASDDHLSALVCRVLDEQGYRRVPSLAEMSAADDTDATATVSDGTGRYMLGTIATSDQFNTDPEVLDRTRRVWHGDCEEMEGAAAAHVCAKNRVPFLAVRAMSNRCGEAYEDLNRHQSDMTLAARNAGAAVLAVLRAAQIHHE